MLGQNSVYEGIVDVGIIVIAHFKNPATKYALNFLEKVLKFEIRAGIPLTTFLGAYHIMTSYLELSKVSVRNALLKTLSISSPCFIEDVKKNAVMRALDYASIFKIESWDGYLLSIAESFGTKTIFSIDKRLKKKAGEEFIIINPIPEDVMRKYYEFLEKLFPRTKGSNYD